MASFSADLKIGSDKYKVGACSFSAFQIVDANGKAGSTSKAQQIVLTIEVGDNTSVLEWMVDPYKRMDGAITFKKKDENSTLKELKFTKAFLSSYQEQFTSEGDETFVTINIVAEKVETLGVEFQTV